MLQVRRLVPVPARRPRRPRPSRGPRSRRARRRRSRRARGGGRQARASAISSSATTSAASGFARASIDSAIAASRSGVAEQLLDLPPQVELRPRGRRRLPRPARSTGVLRLVVGGRVRIRDEQRRLARGRDLPHRAPGARDDEVGRGQRGSELVGEREQPVVVAPRTPVELGKVPLAGEVEDGRARSARRPRRQPRSAPRALAAAEDEHDRPVRGKPERRSRLAPRGRARARRNRAADHAVLRPLAALERESAKNALRERCGEAVREPELGVRLHERGRDPQEPGRGDHGAADVPPAPRTASGRRRRRIRTQAAGDQRRGRRAREVEPRPARQALDAEGVELEAGRARQPLLDGVRPTGERDGRAAALQRLGDRERGQDVTRRPAGGDQEPWRWTRRHG